MSRRQHPSQDSLFPAFTRARANDPGTSHEAAEKIIRDLNALQTTVLQYFRAIFPAAISDLDLQDHFDNHLSTYRTRRQELTELGLIRDTGRQKYQKGSNRVLWQATPWIDKKEEK